MALNNISRVFFKIRPYRVNADWHELPYQGFRRYGGSYDQQTANADKDAKQLANGLRAEVRWNFEGSLQGHYIAADPLPELLPIKGGKDDADSNDIKV